MKKWQRFWILYVLVWLQNSKSSPQFRSQTSCCTNLCLQGITATSTMISHLLLQWLLLRVTHSIDNIGLVYFCRDPFECSNQTFVQTATDETLGAFGYKSATGQDTTLYGYKLMVLGAYSGENANNLTSTIDITECSGLMSCANANILTSTDNYVSCSATLSCYGSNIHVVNSHPYALYCSGDMGCAYSTISSTMVIKAYGSYSLYNAIIVNTQFPSSMSTSVSIIVDLYGGYSGYNASIYHIGVRNYVINCYGNGCYGLNLICNNSDCSGFNVFCGTGQADACPNFIITNVSSISNTITANNDDIIVFNSIELEEKTRNYCDEYLDTSYVYDILEEMLSASSIVNYNGGVCCQGYSSCRDATEIIGYNGDIVCNARSSCRYAGEISALARNGSVYCLGLYSCQGSKITLNGNNGINNNGIVFCDVQGCGGATISNGEYVYCNGYYSCTNTTIINTENIYILGFSPALEMNIFSSGIGTMNVYFNSRLAGRFVTVYCNQSDICNVYCQTTDSCFNENVNTTIYCIGECTITCDEGTTGCPVAFGNVTNRTATTTTTTTTQFIVPTAEPTKKDINISQTNSNPKTTNESVISSSDVNPTGLAATGPGDDNVFLFNPLFLFGFDLQL